MEDKDVTPFYDRLPDDSKWIELANKYFKPEIQKGLEYIATGRTMTTDPAFDKLRKKYTKDELENLKLTYDEMDEILKDIAAASTLTDNSTLAPKDCPACGGRGYLTYKYEGLEDQPCNVCGGDLPNVPKEIEEWVKFSEE